MRKKLQTDIVELEKELEASAKQMEEAASYGDLRENEPFHIAKAKFVQLSEELADKMAHLDGPVGIPVGSTIVPGKLLHITFLGLQDANGKIIEPAREEMILLFGEDGDPVVQGILSVGCDLGRLINNGREGQYAVSAGNVSRLYDVKIYGGDTEVYLQRYPASRKKKIEALLRGEGL